MKKILERVLGFALLYGIVVISVLVVNYRFAYLNNNEAFANYNELALNN